MWIVVCHFVLVSMSYVWWSHIMETRTTRMPAFWGYPPPSHDYPYHWVILDPTSKEDKENFWILKRALHATHLLKLLDKMCKYEMDPMSIVEDTERTRFCPQTDRRTDGRTDRRTDGQGDTSIPRFQLRWSGGYNKRVVRCHLCHHCWHCCYDNLQCCQWWESWHRGNSGFSDYMYGHLWSSLCLLVSCNLMAHGHQHTWF